MKKLNIYVFVLTLFAVFSSCNKLDLEPSGSITKKQFFSADEDAVAAVTAIYSTLSYEPDGEQSLYGRNLYFLTDMGSDYAAAGASASNFNVRAISALTYDAKNDRVALVWKQLYRGINRANIAIDNIPRITSGSPELKPRLINEAKFLRALLYFNAVQLWGAVPLVLHEAESLDNSVLRTERTETEKVYAQIIADLTDAEALPPNYTGSDVGRATGGAAKALLAKVYLVRKEWKKASDKAEEIIANKAAYGYDLEENFGDLFNKPEKKNGKEHIFSVQFENGQSGATGTTGNLLQVVSYFGPTTAVEPADIISDDRFYNVYDPADLRRSVTYIKQFPLPTGVITFPRALFIKYVTNLLVPYTSRAADAINFPVIRYADVLLVKAEALNEQAGDAGPGAEAYDALNQVRRRAYGLLADPSLPIPSPELSGLNRTLFREAIQNERLKEFVQEGQRWFDLVRWGILVEAVSVVPEKATVSERNYLYPVPQDQRDLNPDGLWQNDGY
ncbi:MAG: RagB/SusD family nutrient uptake outer membrane protein [Bacteroidales bacterium]|nr:RagB/SusD family nutrient uptake outer membrane protein [Bacteroidales bacterium]